MIYLKTYFYAPHEIDYIYLNLCESYDFIDKFIVCEYNVYHTGREKEYIFEDCLKNIPDDKNDKLLYLKCDIKNDTVVSDEHEIICTVNEPLMRGYFTKMVDLKDQDIIFSVDADEIIYSHMYPEIIYFIENSIPLTSLNLHQFFYKVNYLWENKDFVAPIASKYGVFKDRFPYAWRYDGGVYPEKAGCHFSWCMPVDAMLDKLDVYSHPEYRFCKDKELLENAVKNMEYPFSESESFDIRVLNIDDENDNHILPKSLLNNVHMWGSLL